MGLVILLLIFSYVAYETKDIIIGPELRIVSPVNGGTAPAGIISVRGTALRISSLAVNGGELFTDLSGSFTKDILLSPGYNVIDIRVTDKLGRSVAKRIELMAEEPVRHSSVAEMRQVPNVRN